LPAAFVVLHANGWRWQRFHTGRLNITTASARTVKSATKKRSVWSDIFGEIALDATGALLSENQGKQMRTHENAVEKGWFIIAHPTHCCWKLC